jgi:23S rRNA (cytosine1962-C5)-methyltransferase
MEEQWVISYGKQGSLNFNLRLGLTSFKHVGVFPEQAPNWDYIYESVKEIAEKQSNVPKVLNLFAYTGAASLAARCAGAEVSHLDSVKQVVTWARNNMEISRQNNIHWIIEDALKFVKREVRRGNIYQGLILDPPAYGHGPDGEKWKLEECLFELLTCCNQILSPKESIMVLNLYSNGYSAVLADTLTRSSFGKNFVSLDFGELVIRDKFDKALPLSVFSRLKR